MAKRISDATVPVATTLAGGYVSQWDKAGNTSAESATTALVARHVTAVETLDWTGGATGGVARTLAAKLLDAISVKEFGARGDWNGSTGTDDTAAIQAALNYCDANGKTLWFPQVGPSAAGSSSGYKTTAALTSTGAAKIIMHSAIVPSGFTGYSLTIGPASGSDRFNCHLELMVARASVSWATAHHGILLRNLKFSLINIFQCANFQNGLVTLGDGNGFAYNEIHLFDLSSNQYDLRLQAINTSGFNTQCNWYGGAFQNYGTEGTADRYGIYEECVAAPADMHFFHQPCFQLQTQGTCHPITVTSGNGLHFYGPRMEGSGTVAAEFSGTAENNYLELFDDSMTVTDTTTYGGQHVVSLLRRWKTGLTSWDSGPLIETVDPYNTTDYGTALFLYQTTSAAGLRHSSELGISGNYVQILQNTGTGFMYVDIDTTKCKRFIVTRFGESAKMPIFKAIAFNSSGTQLLNAGGAQVFSSSDLNLTLGPDGSYGSGAYYYESAPHNSLYQFPLRVSSTVAKLRIGFGDPTGSGGGLARVMIQSGDLQPFFVLNRRRKNFAAASPTLTTKAYEEGETLENITAAVGSPKGWQCSVAGSPGTWVSQGNL